MILPTKRLSQDRALLYLGGEILALLDEPKTVSRVWDELKAERSSRTDTTAVTYDWFVLALDFLFTLRAIKSNRGRLRKELS